MQADHLTRWNRSYQFEPTSNDLLFAQKRSCTFDERIMLIKCWRVAAKSLVVNAILKMMDEGKIK